jgi:hypothetical protein
MIEFIKSVEMSEEDGGYDIVKVIENEVVRNVMLSYDFGGSLCSVEIVDENEEMNEESVEDVFSEEVVDELWGLEE